MPKRSACGANERYGPSTPSFPPKRANNGNNANATCHTRRSAPNSSRSGIWPSRSLAIADWAGAYFSERSQFSQAKALFTLTLEIRQRHLGPEHPDVAISLYSLAQLYHELGEYSQAEQVLSKVIALREQALGPHHPDLAHSLNLLAVIYKYRGEYDKAEEHYQRALHIMESGVWARSSRRCRHTQQSGPALRGTGQVSPG